MGHFRSGGAALVLMALGFALPALADDDDLTSLMTDCSKTDIAVDDIPACMERARVMADTHPSPELQHLLTQLEHRLDDGDAKSKSAAPSATSAPQTLQGAPANKAPNLSSAANDGAKSKAVAASDAGQSGSFFDGAWRSITNLASSLDPSARDPAEEPVPVEVTAPNEVPAPEMEGADTTPPTGPKPAPHG